MRLLIAFGLYSLFSQSVMASGRYGALCFEKISKAAGTSTGMYSEPAAINKALAASHANAYSKPFCLAVEIVCAALYYNEEMKQIYSSKGDTLKEARERAESACYFEGTNCEFVASTCGSPSESDEP